MRYSVGWDQYMRSVRCPASDAKERNSSKPVSTALNGKSFAARGVHAASFAQDTSDHQHRRDNLASYATASPNPRMSRSFPLALNWRPARS
jgi:hypothetical protein